MKRPTSVQFVLGNSVVGLAIFAAACFVWYKWWKGDAAGVGAFLMLVAVLIAGKNFDIVSDYRHKRREWEALSGQPLSGGMSAQQARHARLMVAILGWIGMAVLAYQARNQPDMKVAVWLFVAGSVIGFAGLIWKNRPKRTVAHKQWKDIAVAHCLGTPSRSPSVGQTVYELPANCAALLGPRRQ